jgi:hypothetical protein
MAGVYELAKKADRFGSAPGRANVYLTFREKGLLLMSGVLDSMQANDTRSAALYAPTV